MASRRFRGVYSVLTTPFRDDGSVDLESLGGVVDHQVESGVAGVVCFGLASEAYKLTDSERERILELVVERVDGRIEVIAGSEHSGVEAAVARSVAAESGGATALMLFPPSFAKPDAGGIVEYYASVDSAVGVPVIVQDAPSWTGVQLPPALLLEIAAAAPTARYVKVEAPPTAPKIAVLERDGLECIGGFGALYLLEELDRGITAMMPGCAYPRAYVELLGLSADGDMGAAAEIFNRLLPLTVHAMSSLDTYVAVQKRLLWQRDLIESPRLRLPAAHPDERQLQRADELAQAAGLEEYLRTSPA
jgi:dihydrodipicolinate synthase/N-acetylneuraminate lyase